MDDDSPQQEELTVRKCELDHVVESVGQPPASGGGAVGHDATPSRGHRRRSQPLVEVLGHGDVATDAGVHAHQQPARPAPVQPIGPGVARRRQVRHHEAVVLGGQLGQRHVGVHGGPCCPGGVTLTGPVRHDPSPQPFSSRKSAPAAEIATRTGETSIAERTSGGIPDARDVRFYTPPRGAPG
jgi:hypothetical protein